MLYDRKELEPVNIEGARLYLSPAEPSMTEAVLDACLESERAEVMPFLPWDCWTPAESLVFLEGAKYARKEGTRFEFALLHKGDDRLIGLMSLKVVDPFTPVGEIGYWVRSSETGQGYAQEAVRAMVAACRRDGAFRDLTAWAATTNVASRRVLVGCGFEECEEQAMGQCCHGKWHDMVKYVLTLRGAPDPDVPERKFSPP